MNVDLPRVVISVSLPPELYNKVKAEANLRGIAVSRWIKELLVRELVLKRREEPSETSPGPGASEAIQVVETEKPESDWVPFEEWSTEKLREQYEENLEKGTDPESFAMKTLRKLLEERGVSGSAEEGK